MRAFPTLIIAVLLAACWLGCTSDVPPTTPGDDDAVEAADTDAVQDTEDEAADAEEEAGDTGVDMTEISDVDDTEETEVSDCDCAVNEVCVTNRVVTNECFPRDCPEESCGPDEVCFNGMCVNESCAGVECTGDYMVCRGGVCIQGSCEDPDVSCPQGYDCIDDECLKRCLDQSYCDGFACVDGYCIPCGDDYDCEPGTICVNEACVLPCFDNPDMCSADEVCHPETGRCVEGCTADNMCAEDEICDWDSGLCVEEECTEPGSTDECPEGYVCVQRRCVPESPLFFGGFSSGGGTCESSRYSGVFIISPVSIVGPEAQSENYVLRSGVITVLGD